MRVLQRFRSDSHCMDVRLLPAASRSSSGTQASSGHLTAVRHSSKTRSAIATARALSQRGFLSPLLAASRYTLFHSAASGMETADATQDLERAPGLRNRGSKL